MLPKTWMPPYLIWQILNENVSGVAQANEKDTFSLLLISTKTIILCENIYAVIKISKVLFQTQNVLKISSIKHAESVCEIRLPKEVQGKEKILILS